MRTKWLKHIAICPTPQNQYTEECLGELILGSLHRSRVIHCATRDLTWKARILCVSNGVGHYRKSVEILFGVITVETKIIADPEKCFQELISEKLRVFFFFAGWALFGINYRFQ